MDLTEASGVAQIGDRTGFEAAEADLLRRVAAGDLGEPLDELYRIYGKRLYGLGLRLVGDPGLAEEMVQETFVRLWQSAAKFDPERGTVAAFVFTIARRLAIDLWRRPSSRPFAPEPTESGVDPVNEIVTRLSVRDALDALSPQHREVLELAQFQGLTQPEIAQVTGLPLGTVKTRTYYALRALKLALKERGLDA